MSIFKLPFKAAHNGTGRHKERRHMKSVLKKEFRSLLEEVMDEVEEQLQVDECENSLQQCAASLKLLRL